MEFISSIREMQSTAETLRRKGKRIGFVPTMGFLHDGHLDLIRRCKVECDVVVMSIFVNPTQFGANEDFNQYPRDFERDTRLAEAAGCDILFTPTADEVYPPGYATWVQVDGLSGVLEGKFRPTHFRGVATVVAKLFMMVKPHCAVFGQKDAQQVIVIRRMMRDLHFDLELIVVPTRRDADGLAMSSRNTYLSKSGRIEAPALSRALRLAEKYVAEGGSDASEIRRLVSDEITRSGAIELDYVAVVDTDSLEEVHSVSERPTLIAIAAKVEKTRLIDNTIVRIETIEL